MTKALEFAEDLGLDDSHLYVVGIKQLRIQQLLLSDQPGAKDKVLHMIETMVPQIKSIDTKFHKDSLSHLYFHYITILETSSDHVRVLGVLTEYFDLAIEIMATCNLIHKIYKAIVARSSKIDKLETANEYGVKATSFIKQNDPDSQLYLDTLSEFCRSQLLINNGALYLHHKDEIEALIIKVYGQKHINFIEHLE